MDRMHIVGIVRLKENWDILLSPKHLGGTSWVCFFGLMLIYANNSKIEKLWVKTYLIS